MLNGLWEIPMVRVSSELDLTKSFRKYIFGKYGTTLKFGKILSQIDHTYSHFKMKLIIIDFSMYSNIKNTNKFYSWISNWEIDDFAFHKANHKVFKKLEKIIWNV